jgi:predicted CopG family antitoxin
LIILKYMKKSFSDQIEEYLSFFKAQKEAGLLIFDFAEDQKEAEDLLSANKFVVASDWRETLTALKNSQSVALCLAKKLSPEVYSVMAQYADRAGEIQIMNPETMILEQVEFEPQESHLLILAQKDILREIENKFNIKDKVGLIEIIE